MNKAAFLIMGLSLYAQLCASVVAMVTQQAQEDDGQLR